MKCGYCSGQGKYKGMDGKMHTCGKCDGTGEATVEQVIPLPLPTGGYCKLHGRYTGDKCPECNK
jgi:DnaJ-class molecular chaperone